MYSSSVTAVGWSAPCQAYGCTTPRKCASCWLQQMMTHWACHRQLQRAVEVAAVMAVVQVVAQAVEQHPSPHGHE